jgi:hypothetical protein
MIATFDKIKVQVKEALHLAELQTKTVPWVDALHKMSRTVTQWAVLVFVFVCIYMGHDITQNEMILIGVPVGVYQLIKGKGK